MKRHIATAFPIERDNGQSVQRIVCVDCDGSDRNVLTGNKAAGDDTLIAFFRRRGWEIDKKGAHCRDCIEHERFLAREEKAKKMIENKLTVVSPAVVAALVEPSSNSVLAKKIMSDLLFENYDTVKRDYKPGWDDAKIAKECGLSEQFVSQRRSSDYGPASPPKAAVITEILGMANKIAAQAKELVDIAKGLDARSKSLLDEAERLANVIKEHGKKVA